MREILASLGFTKLDDIIGASELLEKDEMLAHWKAKGLDFSRIFHKVDAAKEETYWTARQKHPIDDILDRKLIEKAEPALSSKTPVAFEVDIKNVDRSAGAMLSGEVAKRYNHRGLKDDTINVTLKGTAGQSFGAFLARGVTFTLIGDGNDYVGKGLSGGKIIIRPPENSKIVAEDSIIVGNTVLYGATEGECYFRGVAGERFAVRNSGAIAVVEGVGDHGCEYMTGGVVVVLGATGRNFAAGMSGGVAYVLDEAGDLPSAQHGDGRTRTGSRRGRHAGEAAPSRRRSHAQGTRRRLRRHDASRRGAPLPADLQPSALHGLDPRQADPGQLGRLSSEIPQGHAGRVPSCARGNGAEPDGDRRGVSALNR
ncbi:hypothetical protein AJ87_27950 [Rhizobium yanglingense]|nr:hypothetical protein AJ87_27950 [Rhizobium yanglingense]